MSILQLNFVLGDVKPVVFTGVAASTGATITSATFTQTNHVTGANVVGSVISTVTGSTITTPNIIWNTIGQFLVLLAVSYSDGTIDHSIACYVNVSALPV